MLPARQQLLLPELSAGLHLCCFVRFRAATACRVADLRGNVTAVLASITSHPESHFSWMVRPRTPPAIHPSCNSLSSPSPPPLSETQRPRPVTLPAAGLKMKSTSFAAQVCVPRHHSLTPPIPPRSPGLSSVCRQD